MVSQTVLCAFVLVLVAVCESSPHHGQGFMSRGFQQRPDVDQLNAYNWQQKRDEHQQRDLEEGRSHKHHHHQEKRMRQEQSEEQKSYQSHEQYKRQDSDEDSQQQYGKHQEQYKKYENQEDKSQEYVQSKKYGRQSEVYEKDNGKIQSCDEQDQDNMDKPCVVDQQKSKQVRVQDTSSDESQETSRKFIKVLTSMEDQESVEVKQGRKPTPVYHGKNGPDYHYGQEQRHNVQAGRHGSDSSDESEENSQEKRNRLYKH